ncbi:PP2C family protein-serine/threonine phosphatase [Rathayibacter sp. SD072]|uniref:PP2C family protein-serine/threonine phosphatase n=1 Tax=Rathayibacter sp. SD072 TaxID=2781731 RepID=UPI001A9601B9|nr:PP2C family protein-serine/threonine phosphatase [Rathayibacter sp. SD072]MBO0985060.1 serine/threonine-protein phosphatase [Rathayibacter sp. SD072]
MLDSTTLRVAFGVTTLTLFLLFALVTFRTTRSAFSFWWCTALALFMGGSLAYLRDGTPEQVWANPLGNGLIVAGAASVWMGSRSLRGRPTPWWLVIAPTVLVVSVSAFDSPAVNDWSGGPLYLALMATLIGLSTREIALLAAGHSRTRWPLLLSSGALAAYYAVRFGVFLAVGPRSVLFTTWFGTPSTTLITLVLLVVVSFSMASLSGEQVARMLTARAARTRQELADGGGVQRRLQPKSVPDLPGYEVAGACVPSGAVSGDFFDWQRTSDGLVVTLADVMGKGVGAAMIAATVRAALRITPPSLDPGSTMALVDRAVEPDLDANEAFVTLLHLRLDAATGDITAVDAGHGLGVICRADGSRERVPSYNLPLGVLGTQEWETSAFRLGPGDLLLICSDGVLDLFDGTLEALERVADAAAAAAPTASAAVASITRLASAGVLPDDVTVVAIRRAAG